MSQSELQTANQEEESDSELSIIEFLPDEILLHIFSFLSLSDIKRRVALVSRRWGSLSKNDSLVTDLTFGPTLPTETIISVLRRATNLKILRLESRKDCNEILEEVAISNNKLTYLKISTPRDCRMVDVSTDAVLRALRACPKIATLSLKRANFDRPEEFFRDFPIACPKLKKINVNHGIQLGTVELHDMIESLNPNMEDIRVYCLYFNRIGSVTPYQNAPVTMLTTRFSSTLTVLKLNMLGLTDAVMPFIANCVLLRVLYMWRLISINDESFLLLERLPFLEKLAVSVPRSISVGAWSELLAHENMAHLKSLNISTSSMVDDNLLQVIARHNHELTSLALPGCRKVTVAGITAIIQNCRKLKHLNLFSTRGCIGDAFHLIPIYLTELEELIYKPVDRNIEDYSRTFSGMEKLSVITSYSVIFREILDYVFRVSIMLGVAAQPLVHDSNHQQKAEWQPHQHSEKYLRVSKDNKPSSQPLASEPD